VGERDWKRVVHERRERERERERGGTDGEWKEYWNEWNTDDKDVKTFSHDDYSNEMNGFALLYTFIIYVFPSR